MVTKDSIYASSHAEFLNKLLSISLKGYRQCTYALDYGYEIWMIRLDGKISKEGWVNRLLNNGNLAQEEYVGKPNDRLSGHKIFPTKKRLIFDILDGPYHGKEYIFRGVFEIDSLSSNINRKWNKISDTYHF